MDSDAPPTQQELLLSLRKHDPQGYLQLKDWCNSIGDGPLVVIDLDKNEFNKYAKMYRASFKLSLSAYQFKVGRVIFRKDKLGDFAKINDVEEFGTSTHKHQWSVNGVTPEENEHEIDPAVLRARETIKRLNEVNKIIDEIEGPSEIAQIVEKAMGVGEAIADYKHEHPTVVPIQAVEVAETSQTTESYDPDVLEVRIPWDVIGAFKMTALTFIGLIAISGIYLLFVLALRISVGLFFAMLFLYVWIIFYLAKKITNP